MELLTEVPDGFTPIQYGDNKHVEYGWSEVLQEKILQFSYQLVRCSINRQIELSIHLESILNNLIAKRNEMHSGKYQELIITLYKMIAYTRDIVQGKGECDLSYMQIIIWYDFNPNLAKYAFLCFLKLDDNSHPYGSWKDIKYFCNFCKVMFNDNHPLIQYALSLVIDQIKLDIKNISKSLLAKWIPREKSKRFGWIFDRIAELYFSNYLDSAKTYEQKLSARLKAKTEFRRLISNLNNLLDTVQIKQCSNQWDKIDHSKTSSITMLKQSKAFLNLTKSLEPRPRSYESSRIQCAKNLTEMIDNVGGKRVGLNTFTKNALFLVKHGGAQTEINLLDSQWRNYTNQFPDFCHMIAMVDCSNSMQMNEKGNSFYTAVGIGCLIAEKSLIGRRILTFSENPSWHNLDKYDTFTKMVASISKCEQGLSANFYKAMNIILDKIIEKKLSAEDVSGLVLVVLSDMQIKGKNISDMRSLYDSIKEEYSDAGMKICGKPYKPPHIIFWNLRSTDGFPCLSNEKNVTMISGYHPSILHRFCEKRTQGFNGNTPWVNLMGCMNKKRYKYLEEKIKKELDFF